MTTIRRDVEVGAAPSVTKATWLHFVQSVRTGSRRLECNELACVDAVRAGLVTFEPTPEGTTRVIFELDPEQDVSADALGLRMARDLVVFKDYIERGGHSVGRPTRDERKALYDADGRRERQPARTSSASEPLSYGDHFPT